MYDRRVLVHEPAKWVARLRATDSAFEPSPLLFRVELGPGGARGAGGRSAGRAYEADLLAWMLERFGDPPARSVKDSSPQPPDRTGVALNAPRHAGSPPPARSGVVSSGGVTVMATAFSGRQPVMPGLV